MALAAICIAVSTTVSAADRPLQPAIPDFGTIVDDPTAQARPDPRLIYKVVFGITKAGAQTDRANPSLERVARFVNLLSQSGIPAGHIHVVAGISGAATPIVRRASPGASPSSDARLIDELTRAGVQVALSSQAAHAHGIAAADLLPSVRFDLSAMTTITGLQMQGFSYLPD